MNNELEHLGDILFAVGKNMKKNTESKLKKYGLGTGQLHVLFTFYSQDEKSISQKMLVEVLKIDKGNISRSISKLVEKGFLEKNNHQYALTDLGLKLKDELVVFFKTTHEKMTRDLSDENLLITMKCLIIMNKNLEESDAS